MTLQEILNTDCYVQFDTNQELREFIERNKIQFDGHIHDGHLFITFFSIVPRAITLRQARYNLPIYHHTTITK
jgi:hypothetical protein